MDPHPDAQREIVRPRLVGDGPLCGHGRRDRRDRRREGGEEGVTLRLDHDATVTLDRRADEVVVTRDLGGPDRGADGALETGRPLDIGEQERDGRSGRERHAAGR